MLIFKMKSTASESLTSKMSMALYLHETCSSLVVTLVFATPTSRPCPNQTYGNARECECLTSGLYDDVEMERTEGGRRTARVVPKHELLVTHTARRSFCTNAYLSGLDSIDIMAISGHKTEAHFLRYIKVTREQRAKRISEHAFFQ